MTGASLYSYILQIFKRTDKSTEIYSAIADTVIDMRNRMISDEHSTVSSALTGISAAGDYELTLPTDFGHLVGDVLIKDTSADDTYLPLKKISKAEFDLLYSDVLATAVGNRHTGTPVHFCFYGQKIYVGPAVDSTNYQFKINYSTEDEPTYTSASASIPFTPKFREVVRAGVLMRMFREVENYGQADIWASLYYDGIGAIIANDDFNRDGSVLSIQYNGV